MSFKDGSPWFIAGQGAIGSFCAANLERAGIPYKIIARVKNSSNVIFNWQDNAYRLAKPQTLDQSTQITNLLVPLKAYDIVPFIEQCMPYLSKNANVILCHNGMGTIDNALKLLPANVQLYFCTTSNGAFKSGEQVSLAGLGDSYWSRIEPENTSKAAIPNRLNNKDFSLLFHTAEQQNRLLDILWNKLLVNCVINPLTATYNIKNGQLRQPQYQNEINHIIEEFVQIAQQENINIDRQQARCLVAKVIQSTATNTSSMLQDIQNGRKTEVDFITGFLINVAAKHQINCPYNQGLYQNLIKLERNK